MSIPPTCTTVGAVSHESDPDAHDQPASPPPPPPSMTPPPPPPPPPPPAGLGPPSGYVGYDGAPAPVGGWRRVGGLATAIVVSTLVAGLVGLIATVVSAGASTDAEAFLAGDISESDFEEVLAPVTALQLLVSVATLTTAVLTIIWMYRIAANVRAGGRSTTWHPLFAIFGWMLPPGVLYVIPFLMLRELWKTSEPAPTAGEPTPQRSENPVLWLWFVLFGLVSAVLFAVQVGGGDLDAVASADLTSAAEGLADFGAIGWVSPLVNVVAAVAWVVFVRQLTARHRQWTTEV